MKDKKISLQETIDVIKSIRKVIEEKGGKGKNKGDRYFSMYCFLLERSTCPHGWTPPMTQLYMSGLLEKRETTIHKLIKEMIGVNLIEREQVGGIYRYRLKDLQINYETS